eukprot:Gb_37922 [translate_table: standard]
MLMHASGGAEGEDAPRSRCRALMPESRCRLANEFRRRPGEEKRRYAAQLRSNGKSRCWIVSEIWTRCWKGRLETKAPLCCRIAERWQGKELGNLPGVGKGVYRGVCRRQFERQSIVADWSAKLDDLPTGGIQISILVTNRKRHCDGLKPEDLNSRLRDELFMWLGD